MVIAAPGDDLRVAAIANAVRHAARRAEIERRALHRLQFAGRDQIGVHRGEGPGGYGQQMPQRALRRSLARQVEDRMVGHVDDGRLAGLRVEGDRSEEHTSELQSLMRISYAVFCLKKTKKIST